MCIAGEVEKRGLKGQGRAASEFHTKKGTCSITNSKNHKDIEVDLRIDRTVELRSQQIEDHQCSSHVRTIRRSRPFILINRGQRTSAIDIIHSSTQI